MKLKQGQIVAAYKALNRIMDQPTSLFVAKKLFDLQKLMQPAWEFQLREEEKIDGKYPDVNPRTISVSYETNNEEDKKEKLAQLDGFEKELKALSELETELDFEPITFYADNENIKIAGNDIKALIGFVNFE